jgi:hypothetical protein
VLSIAWCAQDPELLVSCGKDSRILCWNPAAAQQVEINYTLFLFNISGENLNRVFYEFIFLSMAAVNKNFIVLIRPLYYLANKQNYSLIVKYILFSSLAQEKCPYTRTIEKTILN